MNIKYLEEYSKEELHNLSEQDKAALFGMECAARGVALPSSIIDVPDSPEARTDLAPDVTVYGVKIGYGSSDIYYSASEEAQAVADAINKDQLSLGSSYTGSKRRYYVNGREDSEARKAVVETISAFSEGKWSELQSEIKEFDRTKEERQKIIDSNSKLRKQHDEIWDDINKAIAVANHDFSSAERLKKQYEEYKKLANDDEIMAKRFLVKAQFNELDSLSDESLALVAGLTKDEIRTIWDTEIEPPKQAAADIFDGLDAEEILL